MSDRPIIKIAPVDLPSDMNIEERLVSLNDQVVALTTPPTVISLSRIPSPQITSGLTSNGTGVQFTFSQLSLSGIDGYRVYRSSSNSFVGATQLQYLKHSALLTTSVTVVDTIPAGTAEYYWVTAVSTSGLESAPSAAQAASVTSGAVVDSTGNIKFKNIAAVSGSTSSPSTSSTTAAVVAEMTLSLTTKGNPVLMLFSTVATVNTDGLVGNFYFGFDGSQIGPTYEYSDSNRNTFSATLLIPAPAAGAHTFAVYFKQAGGGALLTCVGTSRIFSLIELG
jgi:hypothetical protein